MFLQKLYNSAIFAVRKQQRIIMDDFKVKVPGINFELNSNQVYHIREVADSSAPDGYQKVGISKHPLMGVSEAILVPHDGFAWDTGLTEMSKCLRTEEKGVAQKTLETLKENLLPELRELVDGDIESIKSSNNELFDNFAPFYSDYDQELKKYAIKGNNIFETAKPLEFLALYWALIGRQLMPPGAENSGEYIGCSYVLEDSKQSSSLEEDKKYEKTIATSRVLSIIDSKNQKELKHLQNLFTYVGISLDLKDSSHKTIINTFDRWSEKGGYNNENAQEFNEEYDKFKEDKSREELVTYVKLLEKIKTSKVKVERHDILINGTNLGQNKKDAARKIVADQELYKAFLEL